MLEYLHCDRISFEHQYKSGKLRQAGRLYLKANDRDQIEFMDFKPLVMSLFGENLFTLSCVDIDSILRKVHRELIVVIPKGLT